MASFLGRYRKGERQQVWTELRQLQGAVRDADVIEDATAVAVETMRRVRRNIETLVERLVESGYQFDQRIRFPRSPPEKHPDLLNHVEQGLWTLALSARAWIEVVGEVDLSGEHPGWGSSNLTGNTLVVHFEDRDEFVDNPWPVYQSSAELLIEQVDVESEVEGLDVSVVNEIHHHTDEVPQHIRQIDVGEDSWYQCLDGVGWIIHRHGILIPDLAADSTIDLETNRMFFVDYLRHMFKWGGFPNFEQFGCQPDDEPVRSLAKDLLPI